MRIELWTLEKPKKGIQLSDIEDFVKRINHYTPFELKSIDNSKLAKAKTQASEIKNVEEKLVFQNLDEGTFLVLFDEMGRQSTSIDFSKKMNQWQVSGIQKLVFLIGGSYGVSDGIKKRANEVIALSSLTFPHRLVKWIAVEQIYRAFTILKGEKYHHE